MQDIIESAHSGTEAFWGELAPSQHLVQIYEDDQIFLDTLEGFVAGGLLVGEGVVVIASAPHLEGLAARLKTRGIDLRSEIENDNYITLDAEASLETFIDDGWPNDDKFTAFVEGTLKRARKGDRRVRAFGEMVAVLWANGHNAATVRLEYLWHNFCEQQKFSLLCSYPKAGFTDLHLKSLNDICELHSSIVH